MSPTEREVIVEAPSEDEAIKRAANLLGIDPNNMQVQVEVLRPAAKGILGQRSRLLKARVIFKNPGDAHESAHHHPDRVLAQVSEGRLLVHGSAGKRPAIVHVGENVMLQVDEQLYSQGESVRLYGSETVEVHVLPEPDTEGPAFEIFLSDHDLLATLQLRFKYEYRLKEVPAAAEITLEAERVPLLSSHVTYEDIIERLADMGIVYGVDEAAIRQALAEPSPDPVPIARGKQPIAGTDGFVEILVDIDSSLQDNKPSSDSPERDGVDYRYRPEIAFVDEGTVIAIVHPPQEGTPGRNLFGEELPAPAGKPVSVRKGKSVTEDILPDGRARYIAARGGRPVIQMNHPHRFSVEIIELYSHPGDVNMASGNINFRGDVWIGGDVNEGMRVTAGGSVEIMGSVSGGVVVSEGKLHVRGGLLQGELIAGQYQLLQEALQEYVAPLLEQLQLLDRMTDQTVVAARQRGTAPNLPRGPIMRALIKNRFRELPNTIAALLKRIQPFGPPFFVYSELGEVVKELQQIAKIAIPDTFSLDGVIRNLQIVQQELEYRSDSAADIHVGFVHAGRVKAGGSIVVQSRGTYFSQLIAGDEVVVKGPVIGGDVRAGTAITVAEAGSIALPPTRLSVGANGRIKIGVAHPNTRLEIGPASYRIEVETYNILATLSTEEARIDLGRDHVIGR